MAMASLSTSPTAGPWTNCRVLAGFRQAPNTQDSNTLLHDRAGLLSTAKGGGQFEFTITPGANAELDKTQMVFGEVIEGLEWVEFLNEVPATQGQFLEGAFKFSGKVIGDGGGAAKVIGKRR